MKPNRPQYQPAGEIIKYLHDRDAREAQLQKWVRCKATTTHVLSLDSGLLTYSNTPHAGAIAHSCKFRKNHGTFCMCECGHQWQRHEG